MPAFPTLALVGATAVEPSNNYVAKSLRTKLAAGNMVREGVSALTAIEGTSSH